MTEELKPDLFDESVDDNFKFINLLDDAKWRELIKGYDEGNGKPLDVLLTELLESR